MSVPVIAFFNNKGGVGKTTLVHHLAWMYADMGYRTMAADLDPQANLTAALLGEDRIAEILGDGTNKKTISACIRPLRDRSGDVTVPHLEPLSETLNLVVGDLDLTTFEDELSENWPKCLEGKVGAFRVITAFWRVLQLGANKADAELILIDLGPNLGSINRSALIAADYVVIPLSPDLYSIQGLRNLGPTLKTWRGGWDERINKKGSVDFPLPEGDMLPIGYIIQRHSIRLDRPVKAYQRWIDQMPNEYRDATAQERRSISVEDDPYCLALLKDYRSLMPLAHEANKPIFRLLPADGAAGAHMQAVGNAKRDFEELAKKILEKTNLPSLETSKR